MPRGTPPVPVAAVHSSTAADKAAKPLLSQVDEIESILATLSSQLPANIQHVPSVQAWIDAYNQQPLQWSALPEAVDAGSTNMGLSTAKSDKKRAKKLQKLDLKKVNARVLRKRQQVESFLAVLEPLLQCNSSSNSVPLQQDVMQQQQQHQQPQQSLSTLTQLQQGQRQQQKQPAPQQNTQQQQQQQPDSKQLHIVDFGCGSGNLLLPLAALFPQHRFTGVDMKPAALHLLKQRAAAAGMMNVQVFEGMIEHYQQQFDVALALHACGNATDHVLQMAVDQQAAFIVSPCCVGKLKFSMTGGSSFHSSAITWTPRQPGEKPPPAAAAAAPDNGTSNACSPCQDEQQQQQQDSQAPSQATKAAAADNANTFASKLQHPRSCWLRSKLPEPENHFRIMARVADIAHAPADPAALGEALAQRAAVAESCKRFVELDRCAAAAEAGYAVGLFKVLGAETMAKNDLLVGIPAAGKTHPGGAVADGCGGNSSKQQGLLLTAEDMGLSNL